MDPMTLFCELSEITERTQLQSKTPSADFSWYSCRRVCVGVELCYCARKSLLHSEFNVSLLNLSPLVTEPLLLASAEGNEC